jgi:hypothetical protein
MKAKSEDACNNLAIPLLSFFTVIFSIQSVTYLNSSPLIDMAGHNSNFNINLKSTVGSPNASSSPSIQAVPATPVRCRTMST